MNVQNISSSYIHLKAGYTLVPGEVTVIPDNIYEGNQSLKNQIDSLREKNLIQITGYETDLSLSGHSEPEEDIRFPATYLVDKHDISIAEYEASANLSINRDETDDMEFGGSLELVSNKGSTINVSTTTEDDSPGMVTLNKVQDNDQKHFNIKVDGSELLLSATASAADIASFLIELGLAKEE